MLPLPKAARTISSHCAFCGPKLSDPSYWIHQTTLPLSSSVESRTPSGLVAESSTTVVVEFVAQAHTNQRPGGPAQWLAV